MDDKTIDTEKIKEDIKEEREKYAEKRRNVVEKVSNDVGRSMEDLMITMKGLQKSINTKIQDYEETPQSKIDLDLIDTPQYYYLRINTAGVTKENINIESSERQINIRLEFPNIIEDIEDEYTYLIKGLETGTVNRIVKLPENIKFKEIEAKYDLGVVLLKIPKLDIEKHKVDFVD